MDQYRNPSDVASILKVGTGQYQQYYESSFGAERKQYYVQPKAEKVAEDEGETREVHFVEDAAEGKQEESKWLDEADLQKKRVLKRRKKKVPVNPNPFAVSDPEENNRQALMQSNMPPNFGKYPGCASGIYLFICEYYRYWKWPPCV